MRFELFTRNSLFLDVIEILFDFSPFYITLNGIFHSGYSFNIFENQANPRYNQLADKLVDDFPNKRFWNIKVNQGLAQEKRPIYSSRLFSMVH